MVLTLKKLLGLLTPSERKRAGLLLGMTLVMARLDMIGVASIMPFMSVVMNAELVETNVALKAAYTFSSNFGINTTEKFVFLLGIVFFVLLLGSLAFKALTTYALLPLTLFLEYSMSKRLMEGYLHQPYSWFLNRHSADLGKTILSEVGTVVSKGLTPLFNILAQGAVATSLLSLLILIDPKLALIVGLALVTTYLLIFNASRHLLSRMGTERLIANQARFTAVSEAFGASKEVKVGGLEQVFINRFSAPAQTFARHQATAKVISQLPRFALEAIAFGGILLAVLYQISQSDTLFNTLPIITLYAFAGYRLIPALQQIYGSITQLRFVGPAVDTLHAEMMSLKPVHYNLSQDAMALKQAIILNQIQYCYPNAPQPALNNFSLTIPAKSTVGLVGLTGSGKSTAVDLILGLLEAQKGMLEVDGQVISDHNKRAWQRGIGYVPQQIYLTDDTVASNIAFGIQAKHIDQTALERAAKIANLHDFVTKELPQQYQTTVGECGVRLSGGQRQRIGIARALYHNPQVLIMDEATSALDNLTEQAVMEAVKNLGKEITIILIAHRLSTVRKCDQIYLVERGEVIASGTYDELTENNTQFKLMANHL